ncbi:MAG: four helix bundle protein [Acidobacteria bacterium]|nr:four helix bundle protein [Acidobacteriota bacterium]
MQRSDRAPNSNGITAARYLHVAPRDLVERTRLFALGVLTFCRRLPKTPEAHEAAGQLRRAANSVRSNYRAARKGRSRAEFQAKLGTVAEEADECLNWLEYLRDGGIRHDPALIEEACALTKSFATSIRTARENTNRMKKVPNS